ncbi:MULTISPECIES: SRPBCC family protein [Halolamina]|uniref:Polyketide cyclase / dehydrase and lipid transport n=1 Tax=Halolamina pelagica TaxID=699431 RepID=A0A1I5UCU9_9EURY|nr:MULTISPECIES: SRPBCC family protein [Halolamina]NHX37221.1 SRPBCC family protein [Halolamina sp. R1-12]SFP92847.1 Polyketide cyclase / dehydrase and lipid transport [Halolamina pelagica]
MNSVSVSRDVAAPPDAVRERMDDVGAFMRAAGFDEVAVDREGQSPSGSRPQAGDGDRITITNGVGIATIELVLDLFDDPDTALAYRQHDGIFEEMVTRYTLEPTAEGTEVTAETEFAIDVALVGKLLDATVIKRQRRRELEQQFDWLEQQFAGQTE